MLEAEVLEQRIRNSIEEVSHLEIRDLTGTKDHWERWSFPPLSLEKPPSSSTRWFTLPLGELMAGPVHALALKTYSPESWAKAEG